MQQSNMAHPFEYSFINMGFSMRNPSSNWVEISPNLPKFVLEPEKHKADHGHWRQINNYLNLLTQGGWTVQSYKVERVYNKGTQTAHQLVTWALKKG